MSLREKVNKGNINVKNLKRVIDNANMDGLKLILESFNRQFKNVNGYKEKNLNRLVGALQFMGKNRNKNLRNAYSYALEKRQNSMASEIYNALYVKNVRNIALKGKKSVYKVFKGRFTREDLHKAVEKMNPQVTSTILKTGVKPLPKTLRVARSSRALFTLLKNKFYIPVTLEERATVQGNPWALQFILTQMADGVIISRDDLLFLNDIFKKSERVKKIIWSHGIPGPKKRNMPKRNIPVSNKPRIRIGYNIKNLNMRNVFHPNDILVYEQRQLEVTSLWTQFLKTKYLVININNEMRKMWTRIFK